MITCMMTSTGNRPHRHRIGDGVLITKKVEQRRLYKSNAKFADPEGFAAAQRRYNRAYDLKYPGLRKVLSAESYARRKAREAAYDMELSGPCYIGGELMDIDFV